MSTLLNLLVQVQRTEPERYWDLCDEMRAARPDAPGCPVGAGAIGRVQCTSCPFNQNTDWLEDIEIETH